MKDFYQSMKNLHLPSFYKTAVITRACAVLESREKSRRRGKAARHNKSLKPMICIRGGFFITAKGRLFISLGREKYEDIQLSRYVQARLSGVKTRSLTITPQSLSVYYTKEIEVLPIRTVYGVDMNEKNLTFSNANNMRRADGMIPASARRFLGNTGTGWPGLPVPFPRRVSDSYAAEKGPAGEAMNGNPPGPDLAAIPRADVGKFG